MILTDYDTALLAIIGILIILKQKKWQYIFPIVWLRIALVLLYKHKPVWYHYYLFVSLPLCWLAAIAVGGLFTHASGKWNAKKGVLNWITAGMLILSLLRIPAKFNRAYKNLSGKNTAQQEHAIIQLLSHYKKDTKWIFTDRPIFAFYAGMLVPPELALISRKRIQAKNFSRDYLSTILIKYAPEQILFARFTAYENKILPYIEKDYIKFYPEKIDTHIWAKASKDIKLYLRKPH